MEWFKGGACSIHSIVWNTWKKIKEALGHLNGNSNKVYNLPENVIIVSNCIYIQFSEHSGMFQIYTTSPDALKNQNLTAFPTLCFGLLTIPQNNLTQCRFSGHWFLLWRSQLNRSSFKAKTCFLKYQVLRLQIQAHSVEWMNEGRKEW